MILYKLNDLQKELLISLWDKGPGLLLELAVQVLRFPEEIAHEVADPRALGLIKANRFSGGQLGNEVLMLSDQGHRMVELLRNEQMRRELEQLEMRPNPARSSPGPSTAFTSPAKAAEESTLSGSRQQEVELLNKLGDLARQQGEFEKASGYYKQALAITRGEPLKEKPPKEEEGNTAGQAPTPHQDAGSP